MDNYDGPDPTAEWHRIRVEQHEVATRRQMLRQGFTMDTIRANLAARRWQRLYRGVYALFTGPPTRQAELSAALLYGGPESALSHQTAAEHWGWRMPTAGADIHVTVPYASSAKPQPGLEVHRSRAMRYTVVSSGWPAVTSWADTVLDLAVAEEDADTAARTFLDLASTARVPLEDLGRQLEKRRPRRYRKVLDRAFGLLAGGLESVLEVRYALDVEMSHGLPRAARQVPVRVDGRTLYEDCGYQHVGVPLLVRLDGRATHSAATVAFRDRRRDNAAELAHLPRLTYGWQDVTTDPCGVAAEVLAVLRREGWAGPVKPCGRSLCRESFVVL